MCVTHKRVHTGTAVVILFLFFFIVRLHTLESRDRGKGTVLTNAAQVFAFCVRGSFFAVYSWLPCSVQRFSYPARLYSELLRVWAIAYWISVILVQCTVEHRPCCRSWWEHEAWTTHEQSQASSFFFVSWYSSRQKKYCYIFQMWTHAWCLVLINA